MKIIIELDSFKELDEFRAFLNRDKTEATVEVKAEVVPQTEPVALFKPEEWHYITRRGERFLRKEYRDKDGKTSTYLLPARVLDDAKKYIEEMEPFTWQDLNYKVANAYSAFNDFITTTSNLKVGIHISENHKKRGRKPYIYVPYRNYAGKKVYAPVEPDVKPVPLTNYTPPQLLEVY